MDIILSKRDEECKKIKEEIVFLKKEADLLNMNLKSSQTLDDILIHQRSPLDKSSLGYAGESSSKNDNDSYNKDVRKPGINVDAPSKGKSQIDIGRNPNPKQNLVKGARRNICQKLNASVVMNSATMPQSVHIRRKSKIPQEDQHVKPWLHSSSLTLPSLNARPTH